MDESAAARPEKEFHQVKAKERLGFRLVHIMQESQVSSFNHLSQTLQLAFFNSSETLSPSYGVVDESVPACRYATFFERIHLSHCFWGRQRSVLEEMHAT